MCTIVSNWKINHFHSHTYFLLSSHGIKAESPAAILPSGAEIEAVKDICQDGSQCYEIKFKENRKTKLLKIQDDDIVTKFLLVEE